MEAMKWLAYAGAVFVIRLSLCAVVEGTITDKAGFGGFGYSIATSWLSIYTNWHRKFFTNLISSLGKVMTHYLAPSNL